MAGILTPAQLIVAKEIVGYLSPPLPSNSAIADCGNVGQESSFNPAAVGDGGISFGLWQDSAARMTAQTAFCAAKGLPNTSIQGQCLFHLAELGVPGHTDPNVPTQISATVLSYLMDTSDNGQPARSLATLTADISQFFERPGNPQLESRIAYAQQVATFLGAIPTLPPVTPPVVPPVTPPVVPPVALPNAQINANIAQVMIDLGTLLKSIQGL